MKIRQCFVSNSSSSSFVIVCNESDHNTVIKKLHPYYQKWIKEVLNPQRQKFNGADVISAAIVISTEDEQPLEFHGKYPKEAIDYFGNGTKAVPGNDIMDKYIEELKKVAKDNFIHIEDSM